MHRRPLLAIPLLAVAALAACAEADPTGPGPTPGDGTVVSIEAEPLTVMSRNLYLGAEIASILSATTPFEIAQRAGAAWQQVLDSDVPGRAAAWADEITEARPHLVGLQEAATYWSQAPGDFLAGNPELAVALEYDFIGLLLHELAARGTPYRVAAVSPAMHIELPMLRSGGLEDIRLLLRDVVLARADVATSNPDAGTFAARLPVTAAGIEILIPRGWAAVDASVGGRSLHFVTTHLEAFHPGVQQAQAMELAARLQPRPRPTVLVGDLNSRADGSGTASYTILTAAGFADAWTAANADAPGPTCCQATDLRNATSALDHRIDYVLVRDALAAATPAIVGTVDAWLVGEETGDRLASGLWPSDHAGVVAALRLPRVD